MIAAEVAEIVQALRRAPLLAAGAGMPLPLDRDALAELIPHRGTMLLLDGIDAVDVASRRLRARRRIDTEDPVLQGHFPGQPIYPGVLLIEMIGQAGLCLLAPRLAELAGAAAAADDDAAITRAPRLVCVQHAAFVAPVAPGDDLSIVAAVIESGLSVTLAGQVYCRDRLSALAILVAYPQG